MPATNDGGPHSSSSPSSLTPLLGKQKLGLWELQFYKWLPYVRVSACNPQAFQAERVGRDEPEAPLGSCGCRRSEFLPASPKSTNTGDRRSHDKRLNL